MYVSSGVAPTVLYPNKGTFKLSKNLYVKANVQI